MGLATPFWPAMVNPRLVVACKLRRGTGFAPGFEAETTDSADDTDKKAFRWCSLRRFFGARTVPVRSGQECRLTSEQFERHSASHALRTGTVRAPRLPLG